MTKYTHLMEEERILIAHYVDQGMSLGQVSRLMKRPKSTLSREIRRNRNKSGTYNAPTASRRYRGRRQRLGLMDRDHNLRSYVVGCLQEGLSPEMVSVRLRRYASREQIRYINHESIYAWLYRSEQKKHKLHKLLLRQHGKRGRRKRAHRGQIKHRVSLSTRPPEVLERRQVGHWEADLIAFKRNTQHMLVLHERKTRYTATLKLDNKTAEHTLDKILTFMKKLPSYLRRTMTFDNGMEFSHHWKLKQILGVDTYFCDVYASWQKGGVENMNGRLRRDLPRKTDLTLLSESELEQIMISHNLTPRKVLDGNNPIESLAHALGHAIFFSFNHSVALRG